MRPPFSAASSARAIAPMVALIGLSLPRTAEAHLPLPATSDNAFALGPSLAFAPGSGRRAGLLVGADATFTVALAWASLGARVQAGESWNVYPYAEAGIWFIVNFGVGYSLGVGPDVPLQNWHWFVGLPIPLDALGAIDEPLLFIEPYYRPTMSVSDPSGIPTLHELGVLVKWAWPLGAER